MREHKQGYKSIVNRCIIMVSFMAVTVTGKVQFEHTFINPTLSMYTLHILHGHFGEWPLNEQNEQRADIVRQQVQYSSKEITFRVLRTLVT